MFANTLFMRSIPVSDLRSVSIAKSYEGAVDFLLLDSHTLILLTALQSQDEEQKEAAEMDGASALSTPLMLSSITNVRRGFACILSAAYKKRSGAGLPRFTICELKSRLSK